MAFVSSYFFERFLEILLSSQTSQFRIRPLPSHHRRVYDVCRCNNTDQAVVVIKDRNGIFGIILEVFHTVIDQGCSVYIRVGSDDQFTERMILARDDQILQIDRTVEFLIAVYDKMVEILSF